MKKSIYALLAVITLAAITFNLYTLEHLRKENAFLKDHQSRWRDLLPAEHAEVYATDTAGNEFYQYTLSFGTNPVTWGIVKDAKDNIIIYGLDPTNISRYSGKGDFFSKTIDAKH